MGSLEYLGILVLKNILNIFSYLGTTSTDYNIEERESTFSFDIAHLSYPFLLTCWSAYNTCVIVMIIICDSPSSMATCCYWLFVSIATQSGHPDYSFSRSKRCRRRYYQPAAITQLTTNHISVFFIPEVAADRSPDTVMENLDTTVWYNSSPTNQSNPCIIEQQYIFRVFRVSSAYMIVLLRTFATDICDGDCLIIVFEMRVRHAPVESFPVVYSWPSPSFSFLTKHDC